MSRTDRNDRGAPAAFVTVVAAVVFVAWISMPTDTDISRQNAAIIEKYQEPSGPAEGHWLPEFSARDTYAQWAMAFLALAATAFSILAVVWAKRAVRSSEAQVRAYFRHINIRFDWEPLQTNRGFMITATWENCGQSPALECVFLKDFKIVAYDEQESSIPEFAFWDMRGAKPLTISVGEGKHIEIGAVSGEDAKHLYARANKLIIYSAVRYKDVFGCVFDLEICVEAVFPSAGEDDKIRFRAYPHHNHFRQIKQ